MHILCSGLIIYAPSPRSHNIEPTSGSRVGASACAAPLTPDPPPPLNPFLLSNPPAAGDTLSGLYVSSQGQAEVTTFVYLALGANVTTFDTGMAANEFVLTGCAGAMGKKCDFSKAALPEAFYGDHRRGL